MMLIEKAPKALLLVAAFAAGGHGKPDQRAHVSVTQPPQAVQLASLYRRQVKGWWSASLGPGTYKITANVPRQVCASVVLTIPSLPAGPQEVRIYCKR